ncbi:TetR/AcrR family transcriptional regulator [Alteromonas sp. ASW11-19]|uniref:TetR/AcrR family transcriptional regulator n=1 Tax=Alteromonas salexigens TaxID=2982530 RepID=A0ABT2VSC4_9ALTE|nr:TetR/AcrR family transcriptional regulator [Alteromonas salexigens]MCU7555954.1 TetR/AcrR family transcriptional regulator [Alteromonas salexigens]
MSENGHSYHHGDLQATLVRVASERIRQHGIDSLSLRKLAEDAGVSRSAPYHHFKDKNALLSAVAAKGFSDWHDKAKHIFGDKTASAPVRFRQFVHAYIQWAADNPQLYELMFGRTLWQSGNATEELKSVAYPSFQFQVEMTRFWQQQGVLCSTQDPLRLAQVTWGTLHGIARLVIDGVYANSSHLKEMCDCAADVFIQAGVSVPSDQT